jgi:hypothetical protein
MKHPYVVVWLAEGCTVQALPTPRGKRNALLLNRGLVTAVLRLHEDDYQALLASGPVFKEGGGGESGGPAEAARGGTPGRGAATASGPDVGVVSSSDARAPGAVGAQNAVGGGRGPRGSVGGERR